MPSELLLRLYVQAKIALLQKKVEMLARHSHGIRSLDLGVFTRLDVMV